MTRRRFFFIKRYMKKKCLECKTEFELENRDLAFLEKVSPRFEDKTYLIPPPKLCPSCRMQRRLTFRNERTLYRRKSSLSGKEMVSSYAPKLLHKVYSVEEWHSDSWDASSYGREFDFSKTFFSQFAELQSEVPLLGLHLQLENENSDYTNLTTRNKDCYYIFAASNNQDCLYSNYITGSKDVVDSFFIFESELCYQCIDCYNCHSLCNSQSCQNCSDSRYLYDCRGCTSCFGCVSLNNKQYHIFNKAHKKQEYLKLISELLARKDLEEYIEEQFSGMLKRIPQKYYSGFQNESFTGDHLFRCKNTYDSYDCTNLEDCRYCVWMDRAKDCYDCYARGNSGELGYENHVCVNNFFQVLFSESCWNDIAELIYCRNCTSSSNLFGCISMQRKEHCILNKQYEKDEYEKLVPRIIEHMQKTGEWGEFFPASISPFAYNETVAQEYFPLTKEIVLKKGWRWQDELPGVYGKKTKEISDLSSNVTEMDNSITSEIFSCDTCKKNFKINAAELAFYKKMKLALPKDCFDCRYAARFKKRNARKLISRFCEKCGESLSSTISTADPRLVYCEKCYLDELA